MESEDTGTKYIAANFEGSQSPSRAVELRKKKKNVIIQGNSSLQNSWLKETDIYKYALAHYEAFK
jgi:hypothetical protein